MPMPMQPILKVENLTKVFKSNGRPDFTAVDHIGFELMPGECLGLIGESGSGKSTVANLITRLTDMSDGRVVLDGQDISRLSGRGLRDAYRKMQMVFQTPTESFDPRHTLGDGIGESLRNFGACRAEVKKRVAALLTQCGLPAEYSYHIFNLVYFIVLFVRVALVKDLIDLPWKKFLTDVYLRVFVVSALAGIVPFLLSRFQPESIWRLIEITAVSALSVCASVYTIGLNAEERSFVITSLKRFLSKKPVPSA